jgi:predicted O-methyltransferase YrrM
MKKTVFVSSLTLILTLMAAAAVTQRPDAPERKPDASRKNWAFTALPQPPSALMEALDANHDGELSAEEIARASQALPKLDQNGDGKLDREELRPRGPAGPARYGQPDLSAGTAQFDALPLPKDEAERKILDVLAELTQQRTADRANVPPGDGRILRLLAESLGAKHVVELGTSNGYSGVWFCLALRQTGGKLTTFEIDAGRAAEARRNFQAAGVTRHVTLVEGDAHEKVKDVKGPVDLVFLDADKTGYVDYLQKLLPLLRPGALIVAHNMNEQHADPAYVKAITTNPDLESVFLNLETSGIGVTLKKR